MNLQIRAPKSFVERNVYKGIEQKAVVRLFFTGDYTYTPENNMNMAALKEALQIRLIERLLEEEGGVYSPSVSLSVRKFPETFSLAVYFDCAPENANKLIASVLDEVKKIKTVGPAEVNIQKFNAEDQRILETELKSNAFWIDYIIRQLQNQGDMHQVENYTAVVNKITPQSVQAVANQFLDSTRFVARKRHEKVI